MLDKLFHTPSDYTLTWLRIVAGSVMFAHGAQKVLGWYGGGGYDATLAGFQSMGIPTLLGVLAIATEFFGAIALVVGLLGRLAALGLAIEMLVAVALVHLPHGFFMNWMGMQAGEGFEYHILYIALVAPVIVRGSGALSFDHLLDVRWHLHHPGGELRGAHAQ
jgi:putative oxidoreductase